MKKYFFVALHLLASALLFAPPSTLSHNEALVLRLQQRIRSNQTLQIQLQVQAKDLSEKADTNRHIFDEVDIATERALLHTLSHRATLQQQEHSLKSKLPFSRTTFASNSSTPMTARSRSE